MFRGHEVWVLVHVPCGISHTEPVVQGELPSQALRGPVTHIFVASWHCCPDGQSPSVAQVMSGGVPPSFSPSVSSELQAANKRRSGAKAKMRPERFTPAFQHFRALSMLSGS